VYKLPVKIEGIEKRKRSSGILHMIAGLFVLITGSRSLQLQGDDLMYVQVVSYAVGIASVVYGAMRKRFDPQAKYNQWFRLAQSAAFLLKGFTLINVADTITLVSLFIWAGISLMLFVTERKVFKPTELGISKEGISVPGFYMDHLIPWTLVNDLVVRPDYVTITRENLSYVQLELLADMDRKDINRINDFAREQLVINKNKEVNS
jgi:hypothetical protein